MQYQTISKKFFLQLTALLFLFSSAVATAEDPENHRSVPGQYIVKFRAGTSASERARHRSRMAVRFVRNVSLVDAQVVEATNVVEFNDEYAKKLLADGAADYIEPNYILSINATPNDPRFSETWGMHNSGQNGGRDDIDLDGPEAWDITTGNSQVVVGVIDTGVNYNHPDLAANMWVNTHEIPGNSIDDDGNGVVDDVYGYNALANNGNPLDDHGHGTHCSGTIGAVGNNGIGVAGVAWNVKIMALKFLSSGGSGSTEDAIEAIHYAVLMRQRGVNLKVLSNSWGGGGRSQALEDAVSLANANGILFVAAAGNEANDNDSAPNYPANIETPNLISVAAVDREGNLASFSNYGLRTVDVAAPGVDILSLGLGSGYATMNGTSMATPHVAGVAALLAGYDSSLTPAQLKDRIVNTVKVQATLTGLMVAPGIVSAKRALRNERATLPPTDNLIKYQKSSVPIEYDSNLGTKITNADDAYAEVALPFSFPYYRQGYSRVAVSTNGRVVPLSASETVPTAPDYSNRVGQGINIYNDDLVASTNPNGGVWVKLSSTEAVITWFSRAYVHRTAASSDTDIRVQMKLKSTGAIELHYADTEQTDPAYNAGASASIGLAPAQGVLGEKNVVSHNTANPTEVGSGKALRFTVEHRAADNDFDGDGISDHAVYRPRAGLWSILLSGTGFDNTKRLEIRHGGKSDQPLAGDYDGDGKSDLAVYRPGNSTFYVRSSRSGFQRILAYPWGTKGDMPVAGDFDGDMITDVSVFNSRTGIYSSLLSTNGFNRRAALAKSGSGAMKISLAKSSDPVVGDFTGQGRDSFVSVERQQRRWTVKNSSNRRVSSITFGERGDTAIACDYNGDGVTDNVMVHRQGSQLSWNIRTSTGVAQSTILGMPGDLPSCSGDYDGDGKVDLSVFRPSTGIWYVRRSSDDTIQTAGGALPGDVPVR